MSKFKITGGKPLHGTVTISGAKNEALKLIAFSLLLKDEVLIKNLPLIKDVSRQLEIIKSIGANYTLKKNEVLIDAKNVKSQNIRNHAGKLRASIVLIGPMLARFSKVNTRLPGGCLIGARPINTHTEAFECLGAKVKINGDVLEIGLTPPKFAHIKLKEQSVTATENVLMYAAGVKSDITISNCAIEPEILELVEVMKIAGAKVERPSERTFRVLGSLNLKTKTVEVMPDRVEGGSFAIAFLVTGGAGKITPFRKNDMSAFLSALDKAKVKYRITNDYLELFKTDRILPFEIKTAPHPGFPTDLQSPMALLAAKANGESNIFETMYEKRLGYIGELEKMGLKAKINDTNHVKIFGPSKLKPTTIDSLDLRSGITLLIAALMTEGETTINNAEIIDRGYENIEEKFNEIGANITRVNSKS